MKVNTFNKLQLNESTQEEIDKTKELIKKYNLNYSNKSVDLNENIVTISGDINGHHFVISGSKDRNGLVWRSLNVDDNDINLFATKCLKKPFMPLKDGSIEEVVDILNNSSDSDDFLVKKGTLESFNEALDLSQDFKNLNNFAKINLIKDFVKNYEGTTIQEDFISKYGDDAINYLYWLDELGGIKITPRMERDSIYNPKNPLPNDVKDLNNNFILNLDYLRNFWDDIKSNSKVPKTEVVLESVESVVSELDKDVEYIKHQYGDEVYNLLLEYTTNGIDESHKLENVLYNIIYWGKFIDYVKSKLGDNLTEDYNKMIWDNTDKYDPADGWIEDDIILHKSIDWAKRKYEDYDAGDYFVGDITLFGLEEPIVQGTEFHKFLRANPIFPPYYKSIENKPFDIDEKYVGPMYDGHTRGNYNIHDRYETLALYDELSK